MLRRVKSFYPFLGWSRLIALCLGGCAGELDPARDAEPVAVNGAALAADTTVYLHVKVFQVSPGFDEPTFITYFADINRLFSNTGIQLIYDGTQMATSTVCSDTDHTQIAAEGNLYPDIIPVFWCTGATPWGNQTADNFVIWNENAGLDHEIAHYLGLAHTFPFCWTASQDEANRLNAEGSCDGKWQSVEWFIAQEIATTAAGCSLPSAGDPVLSCPALDAAIQGAPAIRDSFLNADGLDDTPLALHVYPTADVCAPGYKVPLYVNVETVFTVAVLDLSFEPGLRNRMDYFDCPPLPEGPEAYSPQQIAAMHAFLSTTRSHLRQGAAL